MKSPDSSPITKSCVVTSIRLGNGIPFIDVPLEQNCGVAHNFAQSELSSELVDIEDLSIMP